MGRHVLVTQQFTDALPLYSEVVTQNNLSEEVLNPNMHKPVNSLIDLAGKPNVTYPKYYFYISWLSIMQRYTLPFHDYT